MSYFVYIIASKRNGTLYTGVTSNLEVRTWEHKTGYRKGFANKHGCKLLVWFEVHQDIHEAIKREKQIKRWRRQWKLNLIEKDNPWWEDLSEKFWSPDLDNVPKDVRDMKLWDRVRPELKSLG